MSTDRRNGSTRRRVLGMAGLAAAAPVLGVGAARAASGEPERAASGRAATPLAPSGAWSWFSDPRALHYEGEHNRTYVGYITDTGDIAIAQYDHDAQELTSQVLMPGFQIDDHNYPVIVIRPDRRVVAFWTGHASGNLPMHYRRSAIPEDINGGWEPIKQVTTNTDGGRGWTYANPLQLSAEPNKLYLFWRGGNFNPTFSTTTGGDVWTPAQNFIYYDNADGVQRPYVKYHSDGVDTIHFAFTQGHPRNVPNSIFYMYYRAGNLYRANGDLIGPWGQVIRPGQADKVYNADTGPNPGPKAWIWDVAADAQGRPVIAYANFPTDADHRYRYARWDGSQWIDNEVTAAGDTISGDPTEPNYSGGISLDHANPSIVVLSRQEPGGRHEVERWTTDDNGQSWSSVPITQNSTELNVRPFKTIGLTGNGALSLVWMAGEYPSYVDYQTRIMTLDENGQPFSLTERLRS